MLIVGDCLDYLRSCEDKQFSASCFSPPYDSTGTNGKFSAKIDFGYSNGKFFKYSMELSRVCDLWAINLTQLVHNKQLLPYIEQMVVLLHKNSVFLFDRWVMYKNSYKPQRGERALTNFEFVLLFSSNPESIKKNDETKITTAFKMSHEKRITDVSSGNLGLTPYSSEIPRQVFSGYGKAERPVLDPFCGTGTSCLVAKELGLKYVGVDIDAANIELCKRRGLT